MITMDPDTALMISRILTGSGITVLVILFIWEWFQ